MAQGQSGSRFSLISMEIARHWCLNTIMYDRDEKAHVLEELSEREEIGSVAEHVQIMWR